MFSLCCSAPRTLEDRCRPVIAEDPSRPAIAKVSEFVGRVPSTHDLTISCAPTPETACLLHAYRDLGASIRGSDAAGRIVTADDRGIRAVVEELPARPSDFPSREIRVSLRSDVPTTSAHMLAEDAARATTRRPAFVTLTSEHARKHERAHGPMAVRSELVKNAAGETTFLNRHLTASE